MMNDNPGGAVFRLLKWVRWRLLSVPILFKVLGVGMVVALLFGLVTLLQVRASVAQSHGRSLVRMTIATATYLATRIERALVTSDRFELRDILNRSIANDTNLVYAVVFDASGSRIVHATAPGVPSGLIDESLDGVSAERRLRVRTRGDENLLEATIPILDGHAGWLQIGVSNRVIAQELSASERALLLSLGLCVLVGQGLALALSMVMTRPIRALGRAAKRIEKGDFTVRAPVLSDDEIGALSRSFNEMASALLEQRQQIQLREAARTQLVQKVITSQEEERRRIARELHDQLGQSLSALLLKIGTERQHHEPCMRHRQALEAQLQQLIVQVRQLAWTLRPSILDDYGLDSALARYVDECAEFASVSIDYQCAVPSGPIRFTASIETVLYRVAQEALSNVLRHAKASRASVVLLQRGGEVVLLVEDDGIGFDASSLPGDGLERLGLIGMYERVQLVGGALAIESRTGKGTVVRATIPLEEATRCPSES